MSARIIHRAVQVTSGVLGLWDGDEEQRMQRANAIVRRLIEAGYIDGVSDPKGGWALEKELELDATNRHGFTRAQIGGGRAL
jgi:hypothetical protein